MSFLRLIKIKHFMVVYLGLLIVYIAISTGNYFALWSAVLTISLYISYDLVWTYWRRRIWYFSLSSVISGMVLSLVIMPDPSLSLSIFLPLLAVFSKHLLNFGKERHLFNPAGFSLAIASLIIPVIAWWGPSWGRVPMSLQSIIRFDFGSILFIILVLGGLSVLAWQRKFHIALAFFLAQGFFLTLISLSDGVYLQILDVLGSQIINPTAIFFATVMLVEPMTSTFGDWKKDVIYGFLVGVASIAIGYVERNFSVIHIDTLIFALLIANLIAGIWFLPRREDLPQYSHRV